jgi:hypothetical protein
LAPRKPAAAVEEAVARPRRLHLRPWQQLRRQERQPRHRQPAEAVVVAEEAELQPRLLEPRPLLQQVKPRWRSSRMT